MQVLGMDIGGTNIRLGLAEADLHLHGYEIVPSAFLHGPDAPRLLADFILDYIARHNAAPASLCAGFPSTLDRERRVLLSTPNLAGLDNVPMADYLEKRLGLPVFLQRDVNLLFLCDQRRFSLESAGVTIACYIGTGIGSVIAINGQILTGHNGVAAELGHIPAWGRRAPCPCGNRGCMEMYASGKHLMEIRDRHFPNTPMEELFPLYGHTQWLRNFVRELAIPIATAITLLDPDSIVLGGGVLHMKGFPRDLLQESIVHYTRKPYPAQNLRILYSPDTQESGVIGAAIHAWNTNGAFHP